MQSTSGLRAILFLLGVPFVLSAAGCPPTDDDDATADDDDATADDDGARRWTSRRSSTSPIPSPPRSRCR
jgi:hypothetical protein